ncbi:MAG: NTP transferase domain-containing protein [Proteobacteria bacterium]|nr:NTP transferase domain-containing protein [Pseudomonadota bacterium]
MSQRIMGVILAGGKGSRMESPQPKSLHRVLGKPMLWHIVKALKKTSVSPLTLILGEHHRQEFDDILSTSTFDDIAVCLQKESLGTAHAVGCSGYMLTGIKLPKYVSGRLLKPSSSSLSVHDSLLVCLGDTPALSVTELNRCIREHVKRRSDLSLIAMRLAHPYGYGRILLDTQNHACGIVEERHANASQKAIDLCYSGVMVVRVSSLFSWLADVSLQPDKKEYYLTDIIAIAYAQQAATYLHITAETQSFMGVNTPQQLAASEEYMRHRQRYTAHSDHDQTAKTDVFQCR